MAHFKKPHTVVAYQRGAKRETIGRPGHMMPLAVAEMLKKHGISGAVVIRHFSAAGGVHPARVVALHNHVIR